MKKAKKFLGILLSICMCAAMLAGCGGGSSDSSSGGDSGSSDSDFKFGAVLVGDENEGYTYSHIEGIQNAMKELGLTDDNIVWKYSIPEDESCYDAIADCIDQGCTLVVTNSYGHQSFAQQAAEDYPDVTVISMTGDTAATSGLDNFKNAFTKIYEARYCGGIVAGLKIKEMVDNGELSDENYENGKVKVGYVGAFPYAEVISGFTAFFLGIQSVYPDVVMEVQYTQSWFDITKEKEAAVALIGDGCCIIGQHADSTGAPSACEEALNSGKTVYSVGYNVDMLSTAPNAALTSPTNVWEVYYEYALKAAMDGDDIATNMAEGYEEGAVKLTPFGDACAEGTEDAVNEAIEGIKAGTLHVFDTSTFTVGGKELTSYMANVEPDDNFEGDTEAISDGYFHESEYRAAPYFDIIIDGITELNNN